MAQAEIQNGEMFLLIAEAVLLVAQAILLVAGVGPSGLR